MNVFESVAGYNFVANLPEIADDIVNSVKVSAEQQCDALNRLNETLGAMKAAIQQQNLLIEQLVMGNGIRREVFYDREQDTYCPVNF